MAFCRIDDKAIRLREPVLEPDALIVQDPTLLHQVDVFAGLHPDGFIVINSTRDFDELGLSGYTRGFRRYRGLFRPGHGQLLRNLDGCVGNPVRGTNPR